MRIICVKSLLTVLSFFIFEPSQMKQVIKNIISSLLALLVLCSTLSLSISEHYCGNELIDFSFFSKASSCGMMDAQSSDTSECTLENVGCCTDIVKTIEGNDVSKVETLPLSVTIDYFLADHFSDFVINFQSEVLETPILNYKVPPPLKTRFFILHEALLI